MGQRLRQRLLQLVKVQRLDKVVQRTGFQRLHCGIDAGVCGHDQYRNRRIPGFDLFQRFDAVHLGHADIAKHQIKHRLTHLFQRLYTVVGQRNPVSPAPQQRL